MPTLQQVRDALPPFRNEKVLIKQRQGTDDIINEILKTHGSYETDYDKIYSMFDCGNTYDTCNKIWNFLKSNLTYNAESGKDQSVKSPSAILHPGEKIDCKHYSLFAGGVIDALKANTGDNFTWRYRFASYNDTDNIGHVFVVVTEKGREIWIDPVLTNFDQKKKYTYAIDKIPMSLYKISGVGDISPAPKEKTVIVSKDVAWISFLQMVQSNLFSIRDLLVNNPGITNTALKSYCQRNDYDFNQLINFIQASK